MQPTGSDPGITLAEFLRTRARGSTSRRLALDVTVGAAIAGLALWVRPAGWAVLASAASSVALYGVWAVAERHLQGDPRGDTAFTGFAWFVLRTSAAWLGVTAFVAFVFVLLRLTLGTWIS